MDFDVKKNRKIHPKDKSSIFTKIFFLYTIALYRKGYKEDLKVTDLYEVPSELQSKKNGDALEKAWKIQKYTLKTSSIIRLMFKCYGIPYFFLGLMNFTKDVAETVIPPYAMGKFISYFAPGQKELSLQDAYFYAIILIGFTLLDRIWKNNYSLLIYTLGIKMRSAFTSLIYRYTLKLKPNNSTNLSIGNIITLITKDVEALEAFLLRGNDLWIGPVKSLIASYILYRRVGVAAFIGFSSFVIIIPIQIYIGTRITAFKMKMCKITDERLHISHETLSAIRIIKMYTWETFFKNTIFAARKKEVYAIFRISFLKFCIFVMGKINSFLAFYILMMVYVWLGNDITSDTVYFIKSSLDHVSYGLALYLPLGIFQAADMMSAIKRIGHIIKAEEIQRKEENNLQNSPYIHFKNVTISLQDQIILKNITFKINHSGLFLIKGSLGSGKSTLLKTIIKNYEIEKGDVEVGGTISYASQEPWLFPSTIRQNILFGQKYDKKRYQEVLKVCALIYDIEMLTDGDNTIIEDRGINLSKGQQARINLARAVYNKSDIYVLDDPLAPLDVHVKSFIFQECIVKYLKDKLVVLVSNDTNFHKNEDMIILIENGCINSIEKCLQQNVDTVYDEKINSTNRNEAINSKSTTKKVYQENKESGKVDKKIYQQYIQYGGGFFILFLVLCVFTLAQFTLSYMDKLISKWVDLEEKMFNTTSNSNVISDKKYQEMKEERNTVLILYNFLMIALFVTMLGRTAAMFLFTRGASIRLHNNLIGCIINASMKFFDNNFIGNILNRFSKDLSTIDEALPMELNYATEVILHLIGAIILILTVNAVFLIPVAICLSVLYAIKVLCISTLRNLKRLDAIAKGPVVGYTNATLEGLVTIRTSKTEQILKNEFDRHQDLYNSATFTFKSSIRSFTLMLDFLCILFTGIIVLRFVVFETESTAGEVGLAISQAFHLVHTLQWGLRGWIEIENHMTSAERVFEYTNIEQENKKGLEPENWPKEGLIKYENVYLTYTGSEKYILKNINFTVKPSEKVGIVGRTGAGKSSIISTLFRLYEPKGKITIDNVDTKKLSLDFLRSKISIIPQDPVLFSGTIRDNIDPLKQNSDEEIWKAIDAAHLNDLISNLDTEIQANGSTFSTGQKQLICIARVILQKNKIIVFDEATANMDSATETLIHKTIVDNFINCTVFCITHKLDRILSYCDKVMVLNDGEMIEFDKPENLLKRQNSKFYQMIDHTVIR